MFTKKIQILNLLLFITIFNISLFASGNQETTIKLTEKNIDYTDKITDTAVFAGGCFWGVEAVFEALNGVYAVDSGYSGGDKSTAKYSLIGNGTTGHAESVEIIYDPKIISFTKLLEVFFTVAHDPTQLNYQGPDRGTQYRSVIFYTNENQKTESENFIKKLENDKIFDKKIVTEVTELTEFYKAEEYHQDFLRLNPTNPYIVYWDIPKLRELEYKFPELLAKN